MTIRCATAMNILPADTLHQHWFAVLSAFVAVNTLMYVALSVGKMLPKPYVSDVVRRRGRRAQDRSIWAGTRDDPPSGPSPSPSPRRARS